MIKFFRKIKTNLILYILLILFNALSISYAANYITIDSSSSYGKEAELFFRDNISKYLNLDYTENLNINIELLDDIIKNLNLFLTKYENHEFTSRIYYILGELYFTKAIELNKTVPNSESDMKNSFLLAIDNYKKSISSYGSSESLRNNAEYRIIECNFSMGDLKSTLKLATKYNENYLTPDVFYIFGVSYLKMLRQSFLGYINQDSPLKDKKNTFINPKLVSTPNDLKLVREVLSNIEVTEDNNSKILMALGLADFIVLDYKSAMSRFEKGTTTLSLACSFTLTTRSRIGSTVFAPWT